MGLRPSSVTPPAQVQTPGAARTLDLRWPFGMGTGDASFLQRLGQSSGIGVTNSIENTAAWNVVNSLGIAITRANMGATGGAWFYPGATVYSWLTERPGGVVSMTRNCFDFGIVCRFDAPTAALLGDVGVGICCGTNSEMNGPQAAPVTNPGVMFGPTGPGAVSLRSRLAGAGPYVVNELLAPTITPDVTEYHDWRLRVVTGSSNFDPYLVGMIDGIEVTQRYAWTAAAGKLPSPSAFAANNTAFKPLWACRAGGNIANWDFAEAYLRAAETVEGLL